MLHRPHLLLNWNQTVCMENAYKHQRGWVVGFFSVGGAIILFGEKCIICVLYQLVGHAHVI